MQCFLRLCLETTVFLSLYQWFSWKPFCRWHILIFCSIWSKYLYKWSQWQLEKDWSVGSSIESKFQSRSFEAGARRNIHTERKQTPSSWYNFQRQSGKKKAFTKNIWVCFLIVNLILMNILKDYLIKPANLLVLFASSKIFYQEHLFFKSINLLVDLT